MTSAPDDDTILAACGIPTHDQKFKLCTLYWHAKKKKKKNYEGGKKRYQEIFIHTKTTTVTATHDSTSARQGLWSLL